MAGLSLQRAVFRRGRTAIPKTGLRLRPGDRLLVIAERGEAADLDVAVDAEGTDSASGT